MTDIAAAIMQMQARQFAMPPNSPKRPEPKPERRKPAAYRALRAATDGPLREVVELHQPEPSGLGGWQCNGCDFGGYDGEEPDWPCRTSELIAERLDVSLREADYVVEG